MSFADEIIKDKPSKYETILKSRILSKKLKFKISEYDTIQSQYDKLIQQETANRKPSSGGNESLKGKLKQLSAAGKDWLWGVNSSDNIYTCKKPCLDSKWIKIPGRLTQIEGGDKEVWGVNGKNNIYKMNQDHSNKWRHIPGKLDNISQGGDWVWGVNSNHNVYRCKQPCDGKWLLDTTPSSNWTLVFRQTNNNWKWSNDNGGNRNINNPSWNNYSQLKNLENYRGDDGKLTFKMTYPKNNTLTSPQIWKQTSNPWTVRNNSQGQVEGYESISVPYKGNNWGGLRWNGKSCLMSGSINPPYWWYAIGSFNSFGKGLIPGANSTQVNMTELYVKNKILTPLMVQLSCSKEYVYGLDTNKKAWRKNIDGSGEWSKFGNPWGWQFNRINASSNNGKILAIGMNNSIYETDTDGSTRWSRTDNQSSTGGASGITNVSGDSQNDEFYYTNTNDQIYRNSPITNGGYWTDIQNENYGFEMVDFKQSNSDWKYLGQSNNITDCKIKAVEDKKNEYSSIVYTSGNNGAYNKSCYGGIKGGNTNPTYVQGVTTSLAPNGTSRLGGSEGTKLLKRMKDIHNDIEDLVKKQSKYMLGIKKVSNVIRTEKDNRSTEIEQLLEKLQKDRIQIDKLLNEPSSIAEADDANNRQSSSYIIMLLWILVVIISIVLAGHLYTTDSENISPITYIFVGVWTIIFCTYYYRKIRQYGNKGWDLISDTLTSDMP